MTEIKLTANLQHPHILPLFDSGEADGFLYMMVRSIVGTLLDVGRGYRPAGTIARILKTQDRRLVGPTAPAKGLCLVGVTYSKSLTGDAPSVIVRHSIDRQTLPQGQRR